MMKKKTFQVTFLYQPSNKKCKISLLIYFMPFLTYLCCIVFNICLNFKFIKIEKI